MFQPLIVNLDRFLDVVLDISREIFTCLFLSILILSSPIRSSHVCFYHTQMKKKEKKRKHDTKRFTRIVIFFFIMKILRHDLLTFADPLN